MAGKADTHPWRANTWTSSWGCSPGLRRVGAGDAFWSSPWPDPLDLPPSTWGQAPWGGVLSHPPCPTPSYRPSMCAEVGRTVRKRGTLLLVLEPANYTPQARSPRKS